MTKELKIIFIFLIFTIVSCNNKSETVRIIEKLKNKTSAENAKIIKTQESEILDENAEFKSTYKGSGKLIRIDLTDKKYLDINFYCKDTITKNGWKIEYLVKDDKTKYEDLYIRWSKGNQTGIFCSASTLIMRSFFIPKYEGENESHLFLRHGCSTEGEAILVLPKNTKQKGNDYSYIVDYDIQYGEIGYIPERSYSLNELEIAVVNLEKRIEKSVVFENNCYGTPEEGCIDKMKFKKNYVEIIATLIDKKDKMRTKTIV
jgi:hypothetical protein